MESPPRLPKEICKVGSAFVWLSIELRQSCYERSQSGQITRCDVRRLATLQGELLNVSIALDTRLDVGCGPVEARLLQFTGRLRTLILFRAIAEELVFHH
jgi:hypothetical protein